MSFVVYEEDQFVRADITDTLSESFPDKSLKVISDVSEMAKLLGSAAEPLVVIMGSRLPDDTAPYVGPPRHAVVVVSGQTDFPNGAGIIFKSIDRPFSSAMLLEAVRSAISSLQSSPS